MKKNVIFIVVFIMLLCIFDAKARYFIEEKPKEINSIAGVKSWNRDIHEKGYSYSDGIIKQANQGKTPKENATGIYQGKVFMDCKTCPKMVVMPKRDGKQDYYVAIGQTEVTFYQYNQCIKEHFCKKNRYTKNQERRNFGELLMPAYPDSYPVIYVSYQDAIDYINWLNQKTGKEYKLLNEDDWYLLNGLSPINREKMICKNCNDKISGQLMNSGFFDDDKYKVYDVNGSVWEYTDHQLETGEVQIRGGSWLDNYEDIIDLDKRYITTDKRKNNIGFRVKTIIK